MIGAMLYVARIVHMPWGEQCHSQVINVASGKVLSVGSFHVECQSMVFVDEAYVTYNDAAVVTSDIKIELHHAGGALYAYSVGEDGVLSRLL